MNAICTMNPLTLWPVCDGGVAIGKHIQAWTGQCKVIVCKHAPRHWAHGLMGTGADRTFFHRTWSLPLVASHLGTLLRNRPAGVCLRGQAAACLLPVAVVAGSWQAVLHS